MGLDYNVKRYLYSTWKNGYKFIYITSKNGSFIKYKMANVKYDDLAGHDVFAGYGKNYTAKLSKNTKYYVPIEWSRAWWCICYLAEGDIQWRGIALIEDYYVGYWQLLIGSWGQEIRW